MSDQPPKKPPPEPPTSALHVMPGVEGGHDGMPGAAPRAPRAGEPPVSRPTLTTEQYVCGIRDGDRTILGQAITLIESNTHEHQTQAQELLKILMPHTGNSIRIGITGVPGAGKSTLIEILGSRLTARGSKVAVMAVDPSSSVTRGSILGDKTRMEQLARDPRAFIRPSPSGGTLGGVTRKTRETMLLFEAADYDVLFVETVGVGQNEITVRSMVDFFLLVLTAGAGDELQHIKRGVAEMADAIVINKADGAGATAALAARGEYEQALQFMRPATAGWRTGAFATSALEGSGIDEIWSVVEEFRTTTQASGVFGERRHQQALAWLHSMLEERLRDSFYRNPAIVRLLPEIEQQVQDGSLPATQAAWKLLTAFEGTAEGE